MPEPIALVKKPGEGEPNDGLVKLLQQMLEAAQRGEIRAYALIAMRDQVTYMGGAQQDDMYRNSLIGVMSRMQHALIRQLNHEDEDD